MALWEIKDCPRLIIKIGTPIVKSGDGTDYLSEINAALVSNYVTPAVSMEDVDEKIHDVREVGYTDGYNAGEYAGHEAGYKRGVSDTSATRDAQDAEYLNDINTELVKNGTTAAETLGGVDEKITEVHAAGYLAGGDAGYAAGFQAGDLAGYGRGMLDTNETRDALDDSRLAEINAALTENGTTAADTLDGVAERVPEVHAAGVKSEYDRFWDAYQSSTRQNQFCGKAWTKETFHPKYDIVPSMGYMLFYYSDIKGDLVEILDAHGVTLDTSGCTSFQYMFWDSAFTRVGVIDMRMVTNASSATVSAFSSTALETIDGLIISESVLFNNNAFGSARSLVNLKFTGTLASSVNLQWSTKLSRASIESIIGAMSATASGCTLTLSKTAVKTAFETSAGAADGSSSDLWMTMMGKEGYSHPDAVCVKPSDWAVNLV